MKEYLVQHLYDDNSTGVSLMTGPKIIERIDATDYTNETLHVFDISTPGTVKPLTIYGCHHDFKKPLYIKVVDESMNIEFDGFGSDH